MKRIKILPEAVKRKIAAGEVVEGPFSVVKELVENAIDAGAGAIDVEIVESGMKKISVRDNGGGILREDLPVAIQEHATSKIESFGDIEQIMTYGFRGEALSSIAAIAKLTILTRAASEERGARLISMEGSVDIADYAGAVGTTVIVENLFYSVPARKKFLKSRVSELRTIRDVFLRFALANHAVAFSLTVDERRLLSLPASENRDGRIEQLYGGEFLKGLRYGESVAENIALRGYISAPGHYKSSRAMQFFYVNNRMVEFKYLGFILSKAYEALARKGEFPMAFLFLDIDPSLIDVNIHPAKKEIKFTDQKAIEGLMLQFARKILAGPFDMGPRALKPFDASGPLHIAPEWPRPALVPPSLKEPGDASPEPEMAEPTVAKRPDLRVIRNEPDRDIIRDMPALYQELHRPDSPQILGLVFNTYVVVQKDDAVLFIDFHAAHERIIYDRLMDRSVETETQSLAFPEVVELSIEDFLIAREELDTLNALGFDAEEFSDRSIVIRGVPVVSQQLDIPALVREFIDSVKAGIDDALGRRERACARLACHAALRSGDRPTGDDIRRITDAALRAPEPRCPHGRPFVHVLNKNDLDRMFKRL